MLVDIAYRYYYSFSPSDSDLFDLRAFSTPSGLLPPTSGLLPPTPSLLRSLLELLLIMFVKIKITSENVGDADRHYLSRHIVLS